METQQLGEGDNTTILRPSRVLWAETATSPPKFLRWVCRPLEKIEERKETGEHSFLQHFHALIKVPELGAGVTREMCRHLKIHMFY